MAGISNKVYEQMAQNYTESEAAKTNMNGSILSDDASIYSNLSTGDVGQYLKEFHGRVFNAHNDLWHLPAG